MYFFNHVFFYKKIQTILHVESYKRKAPFTLAKYQMRRKSHYGN